MRQPANTVMRRRNVLGLALIVLLGVVLYVATTAQKGLPWESRYRITVELPNAVRLIPANDVRMAGVSVGRVDSVEAVPRRGDRAAHVRVGLALRPSAPRVTADTITKVRVSSALGANFVELVPGTGTRLADGGTLPLANSRATADINQLFETFNRSTSRNAQLAVQEIGVGVAGRGEALNEAIASFGELLPPLTRVSRTLAAPRTRLPAFIREYDRFTFAMAGVAAELGAIAENGDVTLGALAGEQQAFARTLDLLPGTERDATVALTRLRPSFDGLARMADDLSPAARLIPRTLDEVDGALRAGVPPLERMPALTTDLRGTLATVRTVMRNKAADGTVRKLSDLLAAADPLVKTFLPAQTHCNIVGSTLQAFYEMSNSFGVGDGSPIAMFSFTHLGAEGELLQQAKASPNAAVNYIPNENAEECEAGNEQHDGKTQALGNVPGNQGKAHRETVVDPTSLRRAREAGLVDPPFKDVAP